MRAFTRNCYRDSLLAFWERPTIRAKTGAVVTPEYYEVTCSHLGTAVLKALVPPAANGLLNGWQFQPLTPGEPYEITIQPLNPSGEPFAPIVLPVTSPSSRYEENLYTLLNQTGGFLLDPRDDKEMVQPDASMVILDIHANRWLEGAIDPKTGKPYDPTLYRRSGMFNAHAGQWHRHFLYADQGGGSITGRMNHTLKLPHPDDKNYETCFPAHVILDVCAGTPNRAAWYCSLASSFQDRVELKPSQNDTLPQKDNVPLTIDGYEVRLTTTFLNSIPHLHVQIWQEGKRLISKSLPRGDVHWNLRQAVRITLTTEAIEIGIDRDFDGWPETVLTVSVNMASWPRELFVYDLMGGYNQIKANVVMGHRADGVLTRQYHHAGLVHLGNVLISGGLYHAPKMLRKDCDCFFPVCDCTDHPHTPVVAHTEEEHELDVFSLPDIERMPMPAELAAAYVPTTWMKRDFSQSAIKVPDVWVMTIHADTLNARLFTGSGLGLKRVWLEREDSTGQKDIVWEEVYPVPRMRIEKMIPVETNRWPEGYYRVRLMAETTAGGIGHNYTNSVDTYTESVYITVFRDTNPYLPPYLAVSVQKKEELLPMTEAAFTAKVNETLTFTLKVLKSVLLTDIKFEYKSGEKWANFTSSLLPPLPTRREGPEDIYVYKRLMDSWLPLDAGKGLDFRIRVIDAVGNESLFPFRWNTLTPGDTV